MNKDKELRMIQELASDRQVEVLFEYTFSDDEDVRACAYRAVAAFAEETSVASCLIGGLYDSSAKVRVAVIEGCVKAPNKSLRDVCAAGVKREKNPAVLSAAMALLSV